MPSRSRWSLWSEGFHTLYGVARVHPVYRLGVIHRVHGFQRPASTDFWVADFTQLQEV